MPDERDHLRFAASLELTWDEVWQRLSRGVRDRRSAMRHPVLATVDENGQPSVRTVVLRAVSRENTQLVFHTDLLSVKIAEIEASPHVSMHVWDQTCNLQIRLSAVATIVSGEAAELDWNKVPPSARAAYGALPAPATPIEASDAFTTDPSAERFAVVQCNLTKIETLCLATEQHYRAQFEQHNGWSGQWLVP